jgi:hypothetical protein
VTSSWAGRGGGRPSRLTPLLAVAALVTTRDWSQDCPQESACWAFLVVAGTPGTDRVAPRRPVAADYVALVPLPPRVEARACVCTGQSARDGGGVPGCVQ